MRVSFSVNGQADYEAESEEMEDVDEQQMQMEESEQGGSRDEEYYESNVP